VASVLAWPREATDDDAPVLRKRKTTLGGADYVATIKKKKGLP